MIAWPSELGSAWVWIIGGLLISACELLVPGAFLIWIGLAALVTGLIAAMAVLPWEVELLVFAALAVIAVLAGRRTMRFAPTDLNRRGHSLVGRDFTLDQPIQAGIGRLALGDTTWRIAGPDCPIGSRIRITGLDGTTLLVARTDGGSG